MSYLGHWTLSSNVSQTNRVGMRADHLLGTKAPKSLPVSPVGVMGSGRSSLHEEMIFSLSGPSHLDNARAPEIGSKSKFFGKKRLTEKQELEMAIEQQKIGLKWEEDTDEYGPEVDFTQTPVDGKRANRARGAGRSSPPDISPHVTPTQPARKAPVSSQHLSLSSHPPAKTPAAPGGSPMSAPALSTPPESLASSPADSYSADPFSPSPRRSRASRKHIGDDVVPETQDWNHYAAPVLIPASSPAILLASSGSKDRAASLAERVQGSSDSFEEEEVRTPSVKTSRKRKVKEEVVDPADEAANQKAEVIGMGWRDKYSFAAASVCLPRSQFCGKEADRSSLSLRHAVLE